MIDELKRLYHIITLRYIFFAIQRPEIKETES